MKEIGDFRALRLCEFTGEASNPEDNRGSPCGYRYYPVCTTKKGSPYELPMVQVTGFEPTRLSTLEPETSASAVPPHLQIDIKF